VSKRHIGSARGFTLVEVLVAMLVMAIMAVMAWQGVDGVVRARAASQERLERTLRLNTVVAQWEQDLASLQDSTIVPLALSCDGASVRLTRRTPTGLQVVAWALRPDAGGAAGNGTLERWAGPSVTTTGELQDSWLRSLQLQGGEAGQLRTLSGLAQWQVYFYQGNAWSNCQSTGDVQSPTSSNPGTTTGSPAGTSTSGTTGSSSGTGTSGTQRQALPKGVRVVLSFAPGSGLNGDLTRDVLLGP
jgi:general secretion pathway protein J